MVLLLVIKMLSSIYRLKCQVNNGFRKQHNPTEIRNMEVWESLPSQFNVITMRLYWISGGNALVLISCKVHLISTFYFILVSVYEKN